MPIRPEMSSHTKTAGTYLQGYVEDLPYDMLIEAIGLPNSKGDEYKIDIMWCGTIDGHPFTVYNWKNGINYCGEDGQLIQDMTHWNVGGHDKEIYHQLKDWITHVVNATENGR